MKITNPTAVRGEDLAVAYLKNRSFIILERNFHSRTGEIDIIAVDKNESEDVLVFIEVKTRTSLTFGTPFEAISKAKVRMMTQTGQYYKILHSSLPEQLRLDAVSVVIVPNTPAQILHIKNIFQF